jgi:hypothetical protein
VKDRAQEVSGDPREEEREHRDAPTEASQERREQDREEEGVRQGVREIDVERERRHGAPGLSVEDAKSVAAPGAEPAVRGPPPPVRKKSLSSGTTGRAAQDDACPISSSAARPRRFSRSYMRSTSAAREA